MKALKTAFTCIALLSAGLATPAFAVDTKAVSTLECRPLNDANATGLQFSVSGIKNTSGVSRSVVCPLPRDQNSPYAAGEPLGYLGVWFKAGIYDGSVRCTTYSGSIVSNEFVTATDTSSASANNEGVVEISLTTYNSDFYQTQMNVLCAISPQVTLAHFYFEEHGATGN